MKTLLVTFATILLTQTIFAQPPAKPAKSPVPAATPAPGKKCEAQLARLLIDQLASDAKNIQETDKRVNVLIKVADFLWVPDVESSRPLFLEAFQVARDRYKEKGFEFEGAKDKSGLVSIKPDYRFQVIRAIAKRDSKWARELTEIVLKDKSEEADEAARDPYDKGREVREILDIAVALVETDQAAAMIFFRRAMQYPLEQMWIYTLHQLVEKKMTPLANQLYRELLNTYSGAEPSKLLYLSLYPFAAQRMIGLAKLNLSTSIPPNHVPSRDLQLAFLSTFLGRIISMTPEDAAKTRNGHAESVFALTALNEIELIILQQFPELVELLTKAQTSILTLLTPEARNATTDAEKRNALGLRPFEEKIKDLEEAEEKGKLTDGMIANLVMGLTKDEYFEMLEPWLEKIRDDAGRNMAFQYFYFTRAKLGIKEARYDDARRYADKVEKIEHRAVLYFDIADARIKDPSTKLDSLDTLNEVYKMAFKAPDTVEKAQVFLGLAYTYRNVDAANSFDSLSNAVRVSGKLNTPDLLNGVVMQQITGKNFAIYASYTVPGFDINRTFYELSNRDFQATLSQAEGFSDKYLRTIAVLAVVKDCEKNMKPAPKPKAK